jgi:isoleucyl-tRNA synthetase
MTPLDLRKKCAEYAKGWMENKRTVETLGIICDWDDPYMTLFPKYEAKQMEIFTEMFKKGFL